MIIVRHSLGFLLTAILSFSAVCAVHAEKVRIAYSAVSAPTVRAFDRRAAIKDSAIKILARNARVEDPETLQELYRIYGSRHLERIPCVKAEGLEEILSTMGKEAANAKPADFVDILQEPEQQGFFRKLFPEGK
ncbi:MAG: hypothetical protein WD688_17080 [Candidatus Binatia bacterium]